MAYCLSGMAIGWFMIREEIRCKIVVRIGNGHLPDLRILSTSKVIVKIGQMDKATWVISKKNCYTSSDTLGSNSY
jgi:hypothetical protein